MVRKNSRYFTIKYKKCYRTIVGTDEKQKKRYNSHQRQILHQFTNIRCELQQLMYTKCPKTGILALTPTPCSKCMARVWKVTKKHQNKKLLLFLHCHATTFLLQSIYKGISGYFLYS